MKPVLRAAREKLKSVTPLKKDCGRVCDAACCRSAEGEETGMLLFPGEEETYGGKDGWTIRETAMGPMVICPGKCEREERPLACRLFPLLPVIGADGEARVAVDLRAKAVCPLARQGRNAMDPVFTEAVREAGKLLATEEDQTVFLEKLAEEQEELKRLRRTLGGGACV
ncbi:MAG: hypothetical protein IKE81_05270 [Clostridia bacterium]|nr:hypothetical protein [Clostridia bacterium]